MKRWMPILLLVAACAGSAVSTTTVTTAPPSAEGDYFSDIERYARDLGGFEFKVVDKADMLVFAGTACEIMDAGGTPLDMVSEIYSSYDEAANQPLSLEQTVLVTIYAITAAADNFCPEHRSTVDDFLDG